MHIKANPLDFKEEQLLPAAAVLQNGGICAFPTETVYGLGANAWDAEAVAKIFRAKGRPQDNPLIVHVADPGQLSDICIVTPLAETLISRFWGGPLTLILPKTDKVPAAVTAGLDTVAVRMPSHPIANALLRLCGLPVAAPSANLSGKPSPTRAAHVLADMDGRADCIIDGGDCLWGVESTVLDLTVSPPAILRPGAVTKEEIYGEIGEVIYGTGVGAPKSPGMKYTHYAPDAPVFIAEGPDAAARIAEAAKAYTRPGVLYYDCNPPALPVAISAGNTAAEYAAQLFFALREFDRQGADVIFAIPPAAGGMGDAVRNRLFKSAGGKII
ncbi:MAG: threonylcarbamoyl-AMP synthase [Clostridia bacterium]|nr:threonylcarbamoyl-AMP synthase [Oscillospiraceae bacterium]MBQ7033025.1 threonylcarbamoyl-AMP synthase [Clostridia bacterium]